MSFQPILKKCRISKSLIALCFIPKHSQLFKLSRCREEDHFGKYLHYSYIPNCVIQNNGVFSTEDIKHGIHLTILTQKYVDSV